MRGLVIQVVTLEALNKLLQLLNMGVLPVKCCLLLALQPLLPLLQPSPLCLDRLQGSRWSLVASCGTFFASRIPLGVRHQGAYLPCSRQRMIIWFTLNPREVAS